MKPLSQISAQRRSHREDAPAALCPTRPVTDYQFHASAGDLRAANRRVQLAPSGPAPSFRKLSSDFLATEMKRNYVAEAAFFAVMVGVSAWPMVSLVQALGQLVK